MSPIVFAGQQFELQHDQGPAPDYRERISVLQFSGTGPALVAGQEDHTTFIDGVSIANATGPVITSKDSRSGSDQHPCVEAKDFGSTPPDLHFLLLGFHFLVSGFEFLTPNFRFLASRPDAWAEATEVCKATVVGAQPIEKAFASPKCTAPGIEA